MLNVFESIKSECLKSDSKDPVMLAETIMKNEYINMHGPEHHVLDGACFLTALHNAGAEFDLEASLDEMIVRGSKMPGATCGQWGVCGSTASIGAALAIIHGTGPISDNEFYKDNMRYTSSAIAKMAEIGGPRCCKRNAFISLTAACDFVKEHYGISLEVPDIRCDFSAKNKQCIKGKCPFYGGSTV